MNVTVVGTIVATIISTGVATFVSIYLNRKQERERFDIQLQNILSYSIEYPYLENRVFTNAWKPSLVDTDEKYQRYESYCCLIFNFLSNVCEWKKHNQKNIEAYIDVKNWLRIHEKCWNNPSLAYENADVYDDKFTSFVKRYI